MVELFKIGFLPFTLIDLIDIGLVSYIIYKLYLLLRGTLAANIFMGLVFVLLLSFVAQAANFKTLSWLLKLVTDIWVIAFIVLFQPELRRLLVLLGRYPFFKKFAKTEDTTTADIITEAAFELAQHQHGALMIYVKEVGIKGIVESGEVLNAKLSTKLLRSIFFPRSPLHDGAVVIKDDIVEAARCTLPLTSKTSFDGVALGMRHRAGLGISEESDVISIIVSEETGGISVAENGVLKRGLSKEALRNLLLSSIKGSKARGLRNIFELFNKEK
ncbi:DNA integrity scanning protein DisA [bacterium BMS3Abin04]|nr:DNA integrity scanning protein DisA [bacterium BMS3Abin04]